MTVQEALEMLGYNSEHFGKTAKFHHKFWNQMIKEDRVPSIKELQIEYANVDYAADPPFYFIWDLMAEAFPKAKFILTVRDPVSAYVSLISQFKLTEFCQCTFAFYFIF